MNSPRLPLITALSCLITLIAPSSMATETQCLEAVKEQRFERLTTVCIDLPHRNRLEKMRLLMSGDFNHYLGTVEQPSEAFVLLKQQAKAHDADAQYMYSQLYDTVHKASADNWRRHPSYRQGLSMADYNSQVEAESDRWLKLAAENGHTLAQLDVAESMLLASYTNDDINLRAALKIAHRASEQQPALAESLVARLEKRIREY